MAQLGTDTVMSSDIRNVDIIATEQVETFTVYIIQVIIGECHWTIKHRYSEFHELHEKLVLDKKVEKSALPPKKLIGNTSKSFIQKRKQELAIYLQKLMDRYNPVPTQLARFLEFDIYDVTGVSQALAKELFEKGDLILSSGEVCEMTPMQLFAITERLKLPLPTCVTDDARNDLGHIMDFLAQLKYLRIVGSHNMLGTSNRKVDELEFDVSSFKNIVHLQIDICDLVKISGLEVLKKTLQTICVHKSAATIKDILLPSVKDWASPDDTLQDGCTTAYVPAWKCITTADFSCNGLTTIDETVKLMPKVEYLFISKNKITEVSNLEHLSCLTYLDLSFNEIKKMDCLHSRLGNIKTLRLAGNMLESLKGMSKMYSLVELDVSRNHLENIVEVGHISNLPCLEVLQMFGNPVTTIQDYRTKVFEVFVNRVSELNLDGKKASEKERDTVAVLMAIQKSKDHKEKLTRQTHSPHKKKVNRATIIDPDRSSDSSSPGSNQFLASNEIDNAEYRSKVEALRNESGEKWLQVFNELQDSPQTSPKAGRKSRSPKRGRSPARMPHNASPANPRRANDTDWKPTLQWQSQQGSEPFVLSATTLALVIFEEIPRYSARTLVELNKVLMQIRMELVGPILYTCGPLERSAMKHGQYTKPGNNGPSIAEYLRCVHAEVQDEYVKYMRSLYQGHSELKSNKVKVNKEVLANVLAYFLNVIEERDLQKKLEAVEMENEKDSKERKSSSSSTGGLNLGPSIKKPNSPTIVVNPIVKVEDAGSSNSTNNTETVTTDGPGTDRVLTTTESKEIDATIKHFPTTSPSVHAEDAPSGLPSIMYDEQTLVSLNTCYEDKLHLSHLTQCNKVTDLHLSPTLQQIACLEDEQIIKYFHENVAQISKEKEWLSHILWSKVIFYIHPNDELTYCLFLSNKALYFVSDQGLQLKPKQHFRGHKRYQSDSFVGVRNSVSANNIMNFCAGRPGLPSSASGDLLNVNSASYVNRVKCQHVLHFENLDEVIMGLFDQKLRLTGRNAGDTVTLMTRDFNKTLKFVEKLMENLPVPEQIEEEDSRTRSFSGGDMYKASLDARKSSETSEFVHPSKVKFIYPNDETITELAFFIVEKVANKALNAEEVKVVAYSLLFEKQQSQESPSTEETEENSAYEARTFVITDSHLALCKEDHVSYPIPSYARSIPEKPQIVVTAVQPTSDLTEIELNEALPKNLTLVFHNPEIVVDVHKEHFSTTSDENKNADRIRWYLTVHTSQQRDRLIKLLQQQWLQIHDDKELPVIGQKKINHNE
ncbi:nischarin-like isoform X2 [Anneissia japonica]|uniref:nischarin-like isoform X2 n=1 Tax=Anneissia japonica TaxID=1529436 RepID=UPI0014256FC5|nr:nischarin-like isoform X2 [Anneissia japonica]